MLRKMVLERRLAPFFRGEDEPGDDREECPICMLYYQGGLNRAGCCQQGICSECFLQICPRANKAVRCVALRVHRHIRRPWDTVARVAA